MPVNHPSRVANPSRIGLVVAVAVAVALLASACVPRPAGVSADAIDPKLTLTSFIEDGAVVALVVGTKPAYTVHDRNYIPFEVAVVNKGLDSVSLSRELLVLVDAEGNRYPVVGPDELRREYKGSIDTDQRLTESLGVLLGKYQTYEYVPSNLTPSFDRPVELDRVFLPRYSWTHDFVYFATPPGGVRGERFELFLNSPELPDPVFVRFQVPGNSKKD
jgi:hypothetical protein